MSKGGSELRERGSLLIGSGSVRYGQTPMSPGGMRSGYFPIEGFSFASCQATTPDRSDFALEAPLEPRPGGITFGGVSTVVFNMTAHGDGFCSMGPISFEELTEAPTEPLLGSRYEPSGVPVKAGHTYCFRMNRGKFFGKLVVKDCSPGRYEGRINFDYVLQRNGSRNLRNPSQEK